MNLVLKSIIYRSYSIVIAFMVFYIMTGEVKIASGFTLTIEAVKVVQYYLFEVIWKSRSSLKKSVLKSSQTVSSQK